MHNNIKNLLALVFCVFTMQATYASVVMGNTRVIYSSSSKSQTIQLNNNDSIPYVMQVWSDVNNQSSTPESADGPFLIFPAMFKIEPRTGQSIRLVFNGQDLPKDKESIFYLNLLQIPPKNITEEKNQMVVVLKNRLKIFYRPSEIKGRSEDAIKNVSFSLVNGGVRVKNHSSYYITFSSAYLTDKKNKAIKLISNMVAPMSENVFKLQGGEGVNDFTNLKVEYVNDYGGFTNYETSIK